MLDFRTALPVHLFVVYDSLLEMRVWSPAVIVFFIVFNDNGL